MNHSRPPAAMPLSGRYREPTLHQHSDPGVFARLLASVSTVADTQPDTTFTDATVLAEGEALIQLLLDRARNHPDTDNPDHSKQVGRR